jgi:hypothetical protein
VDVGGRERVLDLVQRLIGKRDHVRQPPCLHFFLAGSTADENEYQPRIPGQPRRRVEQRRKWIGERMIPAVHDDAPRA